MGTDLIHQYVNGWKHNNLQQILSPLSEDCLIIESHGPTYSGKEMVRKWVEIWIESGHRVEHWDVISSYLCNDIVICEWNFSYSQHSEIKEKFNGITIAKTKAGKIVHLREYRMTQPPYTWQPDSL